MAAGSPVYGIRALSGAPPSLVGGPVAGMRALTLAPPSLVGGPVARATALSGQAPTLVGSPVNEDARLTLNIGLLAQPVPNQVPYVRAPGVIGVSVDGVAAGVRPGLNTEATTEPLPGQAWEVELALPVGPSIGLRLDGVVELGRVTLDAVNDSVGTTYDILDVSAAGLAGAGVLALLAVAADVQTVGVQPSLSVGVNTPNWDDQAGSQAGALTASGQRALLALVSPRLLLRPGDVLKAQLDAQATAVAYSVTLVAYGFHRVV